MGIDVNPTKKWRLDHCHHFPVLPREIYDPSFSVSDRSAFEVIPSFFRVGRFTSTMNHLSGCSSDQHHQIMLHAWRVLEYCGSEHEKNDEAANN